MKQEASINACRTLFSVNGFSEAPTTTSREGDWVDCIICIDKDNTAYLTMPRESFDVMRGKDTARFDVGDMFGDEV